MRTSYIELHAHSHWSLLDGASSVEEVVLRAWELGYEALALTDHDDLRQRREETGGILAGKAHRACERFLATIFY